MGMRANLAVLRGGELTLWEHRWGVLVLEQRLASAGGDVGPLLAAGGWREVPDPRDPASWLNDIWAEGGAVVDMDRHILTWYSLGQDRLEIMPAVVAGWPEWQVTWACDELGDLLRAAGVVPPGQSWPPTMPSERSTM